MSGEQCGTYAGWNLHSRKREKPCADCKEAQRLYARERRRVLGVGRAYTFPLEISHTAAELDGLGVSIARAMRESA